MAFKFSSIVLATSLPVLRAASDLQEANPIRRVVTMLQTMQQKVQEEGEKEGKLMDKFMCYCKNGKGDLADSIAAGSAKDQAVTSEIQEAEGEKSQLDADLKQHREDRDAAKASIAEATSIREKTGAAFAKSKADHTANIAAIGQAVTALEKGMAGGFLQTKTARLLQTLVKAQDMDSVDRQAVMSFLSGSQGSEYSPKSGQITGILKQLGDSMASTLADETAAEQGSISGHEGLMAAKSKEVAAATKGIEEKSIRVGETAVSIAAMKNDLSATGEDLLNDKKFLAELEQGCDTKAAEWEARQKTRSEELLALAETVKVLNDDDALELFKKAVPSSSASFVQLSSSEGRMRASALKVLRAARGAASPGLDLITLALQGKGKGFEKVIGMIDSMVANLKVEQQDDDQKKTFCGTHLDLADDKKKALETTSSDEAAAIANAEEGIATLADEIKALTAGIAGLDKSVAEASDQRKKEHADFLELQALDNQAKDLLGVAKNRLQKFYNPKLYIAPPKKVLTDKEVAYQSVVEPAFVQTAAHTWRQAPEVSFGGSKSQENTGVIAMIDLIMKDLDKELTEATTNEEESQKDYETMLADAKAKRAGNSKDLSGKEGAKANLESERQTHSDAKASATKELAAHGEYTAGLHAECDWLVEHHQVRKDARASEMDSLNNAKAVLSGADYSLVQITRRGYLRGGA